MPRARQPRRGFTLTEMIVASAILVLLLSACAAVTILTTRATPMTTSNDSVARTADARRVLDQMALDIKSATQITETGSSAISLFVADRDSDGDPEWIRYWTNNGTLYVNYNSLSPVTLLTGVSNLNFSYATATVTATKLVESAEQELWSYTGARDGICDINSANWEAQYFKPTFAANVVSWKITRAQLLVRKKSLISLGTVTLEVRAADAAFKPTATVLASSSINASSLALTDAWTNFTFSTPVVDLSPANGMVIVAKSDQLLTYNADVGFRFTVSPALTNARECFTSNGGSSWSTPTSGTESMILRVFGTVTTLQ
jgi:prepilin-type N-terminal cleavage/methylation domain-containing protein